MSIYKKPSIRIKKIRLNSFMRNRVQDSINSLDNFQLFGAASCSLSTSSCGGSCFLKGTRILMANGSYQSIETLKKGDKVVCFDTEKGKKLDEEIDEVLIHENPQEGYLVINNSLKVTPEHLVYINHKWAGADSITEKDTLINSQGKEVKVFDVQHKKEELDKVFNLRLVGPHHNYFAEDLLVHNSKTSCGGSSCSA